jgi:ferredoxin-NADP reductase
MTDWLDEQLGRITMYRLVLYGLIVLAAMALLLMMTGEFDYSPIHFLISIIVSVGAAYGANRLFGWLFSVRPHGESAIITGLILALLFIPPITVIGYAKLALVAIIAMASKYIIVVRGRHVFNPAAIAIVIASVGGLAFAGWWIATPAMIPVTLVVALLILYRTKKLRIGLIFIATAIISLALQGTGVATALTSWPLLFVAGIMLTEPLTLPPHARQQYAVAAIVGILMTVPFHYGRITMTPALALVIGNLIGWWFGQRRSIKLRYVGKKQMGASTYDFTFDSARLAFQPGQYLELTVPHARPDSRGQRRIFSIASKPGEEQVNIGTKIPTKPSSYKRALMNLRTGETLYATRIAGDFVLPRDTQSPIICIAGGIGITPYISFLLSSDRPLQLLYAVNSADDLSYVDQLRQHNIAVTIVSPNDMRLPDPDWKHVKGRIDSDVLKTSIDIESNPSVYVSGPPAMVMNTKRLLRGIGVTRIKVDEFSGY